MPRVIERTGEGALRKRLRLRHAIGGRTRGASSVTRFAPCRSLLGLSRVKRARTVARPNRPRPPGPHSRQFAKAVLTGSVQIPPFLVTTHRVVGRIQVQPDFAQCTAVRFNKQFHHQLIECFGAGQGVLRRGLNGAVQRLDWGRNAAPAAVRCRTPRTARTSGMSAIRGLWDSSNRLFCQGKLHETGQ